MNKLLKFLLITLIVYFCAFVINKLIIWRSPIPNFLPKRNFELCIQDGQKLYFKLETRSGNTFDIDLVKNSHTDCLNPHFPSICIQTKE